MKVFQVTYDVSTDESKEITREVMYKTGCWITVCEAAIRHAEEYCKELVSITDVLTVTEQLPGHQSYYPDFEEDENETS